MYIYLDTNKWIDLARAHYDDPRGSAFKSVLEHVKAAVEEGRFRFPLSMAHCIEMLRECDRQKRERLWRFVVGLSRCTAILPASAVLEPLMERAVCSVFGMRYDGLSVDVFSKSGLFGTKYKDVRYPLTKLFLETEAGWLYFWLDLPEEIRGKIVHGLSEREASFTVRRNGLKAKFRKDAHDLRKRIYIGTLFLEYSDLYSTCLAKYGKSVADIECLDLEKREELVTGIPPLDVETCLAVQHQQQWDKSEVANDARDITHLRMAVPYCDVVVTEKYWIDKLTREKLDQRYGTRLIHDVNQLLML